jgi:hypothetical protein
VNGEMAEVTLDRGPRSCILRQKRRPACSEVGFADGATDALSLLRRSYFRTRLLRRRTRVRRLLRRCVRNHPEEVIADVLEAQGRGGLRSWRNRRQAKRA